MSFDGQAHNVSMAKARANPKRQRRRTYFKEWRTYRGLSQTQLAERMGVTHGTVSQLENGAINYTQERLEALADALMCEPQDLLMRDPSKEDFMWSITDTLKAVPVEDLPRVADVVRAFTRKAG